MKIIALTRYSRKGASSRMRFHIFFEFLISQGHTIKEENLLLLCIVEERRVLIVLDARVQV